ncbi:MULTISPECIES: GFA family protein [unclassified Devosia]|uniref:GFA family protein n=1 Tax=unclassified Devosia TaxID=196773 RepID=UPI00145EFE5C|nr:MULTISPECIES: GFA family protein [unclassified Devosia]MBJ6987355.1 GFA family protein [Devosia sp. MC521]QMW63530.1 GFA family protein [Devosia sp. MC521]
MPQSETFSGGCQCGAVRYRFNVRPRGAHICHCRMCQKAFGGFYAPLVGEHVRNFEVTRGTITLFRSSDLVERGFCNACGTPLSFKYSDGEWMSVSIGSLDTPEAFPPKDQHGTESRLSWANQLGHLPDIGPYSAEELETVEEIRLSNHQHPDHDTAVWPQEQ